MEISISKTDVLCISTMTRIQWKIFAVRIVLFRWSIVVIEDQDRPGKHHYPCRDPNEDYGLDIC